MNLLIQNGRVVDPSQNMDETADVLIMDGRIQKIGRGLSLSNGTTLDAAGRIVVPGLIDMHVHLREPGGEGAETIATGTRAAIRGGFTSVLAMPNTAPVIDNRAMVDYIQGKGQIEGVCNVFVCAAITVGQKGEQITEIGALKAIGARALSDDGNTITDTLIMRRAMEYACAFEIPILDHAEDRSLSKDGVMHEGVYSLRLGLRGIPSASEDIIVARDIALSELTGCRVHICHVSSAGSVRLIREAKKRGIHITAETAPHFIRFSDEQLQDYTTNLKVKPPIRTVYDRDALIKGLAEATIDAVASDHAPHPLHTKEREFELASFGINSIEMSLSVVLDTLYHNKKITLSRLVDAYSCAPARILSLENKGTLKPGADGDVTIIDPDIRRTIRVAEMISKSANSPYIGMELKGDVSTVIAGGVVRYTEGTLQC